MATLTCPVDGSPEFKACRMCPECSITRAWQAEFRPSLRTRIVRWLRALVRLQHDPSHDNPNRA